jgi:hypothetical protein
MKEGDILIGKITPKGETDPSPEEKLLRAIFGDKAGDVKDASMKAPPSTKGVVIDKKLFARAVKDKKTKGSEKAVLEKIAKEEGKELADLKNLLVEKLMELIGGENSAGVFNKYKEEQIRKGVKVQRQGAPGKWTISPWIPQVDRGQEDQRTGSPAHPQLHHPPQRHQRCVQAQEVPGEHRRRTARRHREAGQGVPRRQAQADGGRQDGRPPRQQGHREPHRARCRHALPGGRHSGGHRAEPAWACLPA